jgi:hypothetical protein
MVGHATEPATRLHGRRLFPSESVKAKLYTVTMQGPASASGNQVQRRDRFRAYMRSFNPTAPARAVIEAGLVFEDLHRMLFRNLAGRADLEPGSQQLVVGGIGSGKTTELLLAAKWFTTQGDGLALYIDITEETDLSGLNSGSLIASFGIHLARRVLHHPGVSIPDFKSVHRRFSEYAYGKQERVWVPEDDMSFLETDDDDDDDDDGLGGGYFEIRETPGKLKPPLPVLRRDIRDIRQPLEQLVTAARGILKDVIVIFDGLDRLLTPEKFWSVAHQDFRVFRDLKVSVLAAAPISVLFGAGVGHSVSDQFDRVHHLSVLAADPENGSLQSVLRKRGGYELLNEADAELVCRYSGGVLRDLVSLARDAAEEAYISGHDSVTPADVEKVVQQLGTAYLRGLGPEAIKTLLGLEKSKSFQISRPANVELLVTRRVLEYSSTDFRVHPALLAVIPRTEPKRA